MGTQKSVALEAKSASVFASLRISAAPRKIRKKSAIPGGKRRSAPIFFPVASAFLPDGFCRDGRGDASVAVTSATRDDARNIRRYRPRRGKLPACKKRPGCGDHRHWPARQTPRIGYNSGVRFGRRVA